MRDLATRYRDGIRGMLGADQSVGLFWKGRAALYAILKALGIGPGDEVILPGFTCVVVPNVILYLGARPVYADIDRRTYTVDAAGIEAKITPRTRAILAQNTFGLSADLDALMAIAERHGLDVIEDCAHGFGGTYKGRPNGTTARAAFFSTQWSKPYSTGLGGIAVTKDPGLARRIAALEDAAVEPSFREEATLRVLLGAHRALLTPFTYPALVETYRLLSRAGLVVGSSQNEELDGTRMPARFLKKMSAVQMSSGLRALETLASDLEHRKTMASRYDRLLAELGRPLPFRPSYAEHTFLRYPLPVDDKPGFLARAAAAGLECGDWFASPLHPVETDLARWSYAPGDSPVAEAVCRRLVNLPTHGRTDERYLRRLQGLLRSFEPSTSRGDN